MLSRPNSSLALSRLNAVKISLLKGSDNGPDSTPKHAEHFSFSQGIERLTHLEMADKRRSNRCDIDSCKSKSHDEWFERYPAKVK